MGTKSGAPTLPLKQWLLTAALSVAACFPAMAGGPDADRLGLESKTQWVDSVIVKMKRADKLLPGVVESAATTAADVARARSVASARLGQTLGVAVASGRGQVTLRLPNRMSRAQAQEVAATLAQDADVEYAEPNYRAFALLTPNDAQYSAQWHYQTPSGTNIAGINAPVAWDTTTGSASVVVAVVDTGIITHADLNARVVAGYDMISDTASANDGDGRDSNPQDAGDWVTTAESNTVGGAFENCSVRNSSWHGSHVAGTIGAQSNNSIGVAGVNWNVSVQPIRVLGKCGGTITDIADGIRWAAGLAVSGLPLNPTPAKVINMSLGGSAASCPTTYQSAINDAVAAGTTVVVAAGNNNANLSTTAPANCANVIVVTSLTQEGARSSFSNFGVGATATIAAPGSLILSTLNSGLTTQTVSPGGDAYVYYSGTSMATPHVAGVAALLRSVNATLTPDEIRRILVVSARPFIASPSSGTACTAAICGAGMLDAAAAVALAATWSSPKIAFTTTAVAVSEGSSAQVRVARLGPATGALSVNYATADGTAVAPNDYTATVGTLTWPAGDLADKTISVPILSDALVESTEFFSVALSGPTGGVISGNSAVTVTVADNCAALPLSLPTAGIPVNVSGSFSSSDCILNPRAGNYYTDRFAVTLAAGERISVDLRGREQALDTYLHLTDSSGNILASNDDDGISAGSRIWRYSIASAGTYVIVASTYDAEAVGNYGMMVVRDAASGVSCSLDMDGDNQVLAYKEGLVLVRSMLGFSAANAIVGTGITLSQWNSARANLNANCGTNLTP